MGATRYHPGGFVPAAPAQNRAEQWDDATQTYTAWSPVGAVTSTRPYTAEEVGAASATAVTAVASANASTLQARATNALAANTAYRAIATPTNAQVVAQVDLLTQECSALIRLLLNQLSATT